MTTLVLCALAALAVPVAATRAGEPADGRPSLRRSSARDAPRPHTTALLAARLRKQEPAQASSSAVAGGLAGVALASEVIPYANTALLLFLLQRLTGARSMVDVLDLMVSVFGTLGWASYPVYAALLVGLQVVPLISGLLIIILAGALYGPLWGTAASGKRGPLCPVRGQRPTCFPGHARSGRGAPTHPGVPPEPLGSVPWPPHPASARAEDSFAACRRQARCSCRSRSRSPRSSAR